MKDLIILFLAILVLFSTHSQALQVIILACGVAWAVYWMRNCDKIGNEKGSDAR